MFYRRGAIWKTCNACSAAQTARRKEETLRANTAQYQQAQTAWPGMDVFHMAGHQILGHQGEYARAQQAFEHRQQQQFESMPRISNSALDYLWSEDTFEPSPQEVLEQQLCMNGMPAGQGMTSSIIHGPNTSADLRDFLIELEQQPLPLFDFEEYAANELHKSSHRAQMDVDEPVNVDTMMWDQAQTLLAFDSSDYETTIPQVTAPTKPAPLSFSSFFTTFNPTQDLMQQPSSPRLGLTGEARATHLIAEYGLAVRLQALYHRWSGHDHRGNGQLHQFFTELYAIHQMEVKHNFTPWLPFSGWLVIYEQEFNDFATDYELFAHMSWQSKRHCQARKLRLSRSLKSDLRDTFKEQMASSEQELRKLLVELTGRSEKEVGGALRKELLTVQQTVKNDCAAKGILLIPVNKYGEYTVPK
ncbi:hypothetical protein G6514_006480 [Epicoccum nigrum]|nr:hypothetical protein G6514_006480 [Epicoccum nigrum]